VALVGAYVLMLNAVPALQAASQDMVLVRLVGRTVRQLSLCILPVTLLYSIERYDLWNIDILISRTLVYVPLTSILAVIYATSLALTQKFFIAATGQESQFAMVLTTLLLTVVFTPIRTELQKFVDAHFKEAPNRFQRLDAFEQQVSDVAEIIDLHRVSAKLLTESVQAFGAIGGALFLIEDGRPRLVHITQRWDGPIVVRVGLTYGALCVGWLVLGARANGGAYSAAEIARLQETVADVAHVIALLRLAEYADGAPSMALDAVQADGIVLPMAQAR